MRILRHSRVLTLSALLGAITLTGCATAPSTAPVPAPAGAGTETALDPAVQEALDALLEAGATAAVVDVRDGEQQSAAAGGVRGLDDATAATAEDRLRIASITKSITATVVLQLVDEGELALDDEVDTLLPGLLDAPAPVTVRQLLNHRSGLPEYLDVLVPDANALLGHADEEYTAQQLLEAAQTKPWVAEPGAQFSYSNGNYVALGLIAEEVGGAPLPQLIQQRVLDPLGMDDTEYPSAAELPEGALRGDVEIGGEQVDVSDTPPSLWSSGAALTSSVGDVSTFFQALLGGELVSDESLAAMQEIGVEGYGLGLLAGGDACGVQPPELVFGQRGNGFGYRVMAFGSQDGERMTTVAWTGGAFDPAADPLVQPGNDLLIAGLASTCPAA